MKTIDYTWLENEYKVKIEHEKLMIPLHENTVYETKEQLIEKSERRIKLYEEFLLNLKISVRD